MELQIQDLVSSIRKEGIDQARLEADTIIADAEKKAASIVSDAKTEAESLKESAEKEIEILRERAVVSSEQAKRDAMLAFKDEVYAVYEKLLSAKVKDTLSGETLGKLIRAALEGENLSAYTAEVAEVSDALKSELAQELRSGLTIRPVRGVQAGFRLASNDGSGYFDCSDEEIMEMLMPYFRNLDI